MEERILEPSELIVTYIHREDSEKLKKTWNWLDGMLKEGKMNEIPKITAVLDSVKKKKLVYDGNIRVAHAGVNAYNLGSLALADQHDLDEYLKEHEKLWMGITDFHELLEYLMNCAKYPHECGDMPDNIRRKIEQKHWEWMQEGKIRAFGWYDDD